MSRSNHQLQKKRASTLRRELQRLKQDKGFNYAEIARLTGLTYVKAYRYAQGKNAPWSEADYSSLRERIRELQQQGAPHSITIVDAPQEAVELPWTVIAAGGLITACAAAAVAMQVL